MENIEQQIADLQKGIKKLEKANKKWPYDKRTKKIERMKLRLAKLKEE